MPFILITHHHYHGDQGPQPPASSWLYNTLEKIMAQIDDLNAALAALQTDADAIKAGVAAQAEAMANLQATLTQLQQTTPPQVDLTGAISQATAIKGELDGIVAGFPAAAPSEPASGGTPTSDPSAGSSSSTSSSSDTSGSTATDTGSTSGSESTSGSTDASATQTDTQP
jgi:hypothetical protein